MQIHRRHYHFLASCCRCHHWADYPHYHFQEAINLGAASTKRFLHLYWNRLPPSQIQIRNLLRILRSCHMRSRPMLLNPTRSRAITVFILLPFQLKWLGYRLDVSLASSLRVHGHVRVPSLQVDRLSLWGSWMPLGSLKFLHIVMAVGIKVFP